MKGKRSTYSYYDYINGYSARFMNQYQSGQFAHLGRGTNYLELLRLKAVWLKSNGNWNWFDYKLGKKFTYMIYFPLFLFVGFFYVLTPVWRRLDERYHLRYGQGEEEDIEDLEPFITYQQRKKPMTRKRFADAIKIVYDGREEIDYATEQPMRYR